MKARVKPDDRWETTTACAGREYLKTEWREVPLGMEDEARANPHLDVDESGAEPAAAEAAAEPTAEIVTAVDGQTLEGAAIERVLAGKGRKK